MNSPNPKLSPSEPTAETETVEIPGEFFKGDVRAGLEAMRRRLLDLTGRNQLLNFRHTKGGSLTFVEASLDGMGQHLLAGRESLSTPVPVPPAPAGPPPGPTASPPVADGSRRRPRPPVLEAAALAGIPADLDLEGNPPGGDPGRLQTLLYPEDLEMVLRKLSGAARSAIEETGANVLYLVFGFLEYLEREDADKSRLAPLLLLPVAFRKGSPDPRTGTDRYHLEAAEGGAGLNANFSLQELLRRDFATHLPDLEADDDGEAELPESYLRRVEPIFAAKAGWRVRQRLSLALLSFGKLLMYRDLDPATWPPGASPADHPRVREFFVGRPREGEPEHAAEHPLDDPALAARVPELIYDADSSQHSALVDALDGRNLVIEGPPGTGKSQTITNLIAAALARGKSVLFVAEKLAALEVVRSRLNAAGLGAFCLELHSHKTQKRALLDDVGKRLNHAPFGDPAGLDEKLSLLHDQRRRLNDYAALLQTPFGVRGLSVFAILGAAQRRRAELGPTVCAGLRAVSLAGVERMDATAHAEREGALSAFGQHLEETRAQAEGGNLRNHPWHGVRNGSLAYGQTDDLVERLRTANAQAEAVEGAGVDLARRTGLRAPESLAACRALAKAVGTLPEPETAGADQVVPSLIASLAEPAASAHLTSFAGHLRQCGQLRADAGGVLGRELDVSDAELRTLSEARAALIHLCPSASTAGEAGAVADRLERLAGWLTGVLPGLKELARQLSDEDVGAVISPLGLADLAPLAGALELAVRAPADALHLRQLLPDPEAAAPFLREARREAEPLLAQRDDLGARFRLQGLPAAAELARLAAVAANAGVFRFLSGEFRAAKRAYLGLRRAPAQPSKEVMQADLHALADLRERLERFEAKASYRTALGALFDGLDTPFEASERLLAWLEEIRRRLPGPAGTVSARLARALRVAPAATLAGIAELSPHLHDLSGLATALQEARRDLWPAERQWPEGDLADLATALGRLPVEIRAARGTLTAVGVHPDLGLTALGQALETLGRLRQLEAGLAADTVAESLLGDHFAGPITDGPRLERTLGLVAAVLTAPIGQPAQAWLLGEDTANRLGEMHAGAAALTAEADHLEETSLAFADLGQVDRAEWFGQAGASPWPTFRGRARRALAAAATLPTFLAYVRARATCAELKLGPLVEHAEAGLFPARRASEAFALIYHESLARVLLTAHPALDSFSGLTHGGVRARYAALDREVRDLYRQRAASLIANARRVPWGVSAGPVGGLSQRGLLLHELGKQKRHVPIRKLLDRAGEALLALKPCFMMGPLSVAQYLKPGGLAFDLIVMDEASQLRPEDALGAVARGGQLVVVGDPKQLPPTDFFQRLLEEPDDDEDAAEVSAATEAESILDLASSLHQPLRRLRWHYRSRHESLIAFSNQEFYEGDLIVFPSPAAASSEGLGVRFEHVADGVLRDRRNPREAERVVAAALAHMREHPQESLGIAALNAPQRELIENLFEAARKTEPAAEAFVARREDTLDSFFIKNLENVQGDERDVIFVSVTYGPPTPGGAVPQRFGPINGPSGHRRLNVLFTRAKRRLVIFSSLTADDVRADEKSGRGVRALKGYLAFARSGRLEGQARVGERPPDSDFEVAVAAALRDRGLDVVHQVGVAGYFVDLAVRHPQRADAFLLGVECDGATYHRGRSARDRDRLRQQVLEDLGWRIHRVWSTDWFKYPQGETDKVIARVEALLAQERIAQEAAAVVNPPDRDLAASAPTVTVSKDAPMVEPAMQRELKLEPRQASPRPPPPIPSLGAARLTPEAARQQLITLRETVLKVAFPDADSTRGLLRKGMLDALLKAKPTTLADWVTLIPFSLRGATDPAQVKAHLSEVLAILARVGE